MKPSDFELFLKPKRRASFLTASKSAIWCSSEFLIEENFDSFHNSCKKIDLSKVQAFVYYKTFVNLIKNIFVFLMMMIPVFIYFLNDTNSGVDIALACFFALFLGIFIVKMIEGSSCNFYLITAVGIHKLDGVINVGRATKLIEKLDVYIHNNQGIVNSEDIISRLPELKTLVTRRA